MNEVDLGSVLGFQNGGTALEKGNNDISQGTSSLLCYFGALVLRADVKILHPSHKSFMEDESLGFEKNIEKVHLGGFFGGSNRHKDKATSLRFSCTSWLLLWKEAYLLEIKRAVIRILEP
ncbi:hypothetical protein [Bartonella sp. TS82HLJMH]|uniref:hypothetical protein n=1 Tax=Bartonella sp. TS82HLJMH TaxID=3243577 RepID=UPI0035D04A58